MIAQQLPVTSPRRDKGRLDRGAAAVEMALLLPLLLFIIMGLIDLGRAYNAQVQLSQAAREGVRLASLNTTGVASGSIAANPYGDLAIADRVTKAAGGVPSFSTDCTATLPTTSVSYSCTTTPCPVVALASSEASVTVRAHFDWITGISAMSNFFGSTFSAPTTMSSKGVMRCTG